MSLAALFRDHGHAVPLYALPTGRLSGDPGGMPIREHTFHGGALGEDPPAGGEHWWLQEGALEADRQAMTEHFPTFREIAADRDRPPAWTGTIDSGYGVFDVLLMHRHDQGLPQVVPLKSKILTRREGKRSVLSPHLYLNGDLCVASRSDWLAGRDSMATVASWTAHWYACHIQWRLTGKWPQESYSPRKAA